jgi:hypothetical protein
MKKAHIFLIICISCSHSLIAQCDDVQMYDIYTPMGNSVETWLMCESSIDRWIGYSYTTAEDIYMTDGSYTEISQATYPGKVSWASGLLYAYI